VTKAEVRSVLDSLMSNGVENIIALRGDPPGGGSDWVAHPDGFGYSRQLVEEAVSRKTNWFSIAVAGFPEVHPRAVSREADLRYLKEKVDAGPDAVITQLFFDNDAFGKGHLREPLAVEGTARRGLDDVAGGLLGRAQSPATPVRSHPAGWARSPER
jgi:5,10-methylenetetrahydrofolate reductase